MKKYFSGLLTGLLIMATFSVFASNKNITVNPFPVLIDGIVSQVEGYNIDGFTFLKLADFKKAGLTVKFNETDKQIEVTSQITSSTATPGDANIDIGGDSSMRDIPQTMPESPDKEIIYEGLAAVKVNESIYVVISDLNAKKRATFKYMPTEHKITILGNGKSITFSTDNESEIVLKNGKYCVKYDLIRQLIEGN